MSVCWNKNIHRSKLYQENTHWRNSFLQPLLLNVLPCVILERVQQSLVYFGLLICISRDETTKQILFMRRKFNLLQADI